MNNAGQIGLALGYLTVSIVVGLHTTAKRYLRQLTEFGYLESHGGNRNRSYRIRDFK